MPRSFAARTANESVVPLGVVEPLPPDATACVTVTSIVRVWLASCDTGGSTDDVRQYYSAPLGNIIIKPGTT